MAMDCSPGGDATNEESCALEASPHHGSQSELLNNAERLTMRWLPGSILIAFAVSSNAAPPAQPLERNGSCPSGYSSSGEYCVPNKDARFAIARDGSCPSGYSSSGNYCVASSDHSKLAIHRPGSCPSGFSSSGNDCLSNR